MELAYDIIKKKRDVSYHKDIVEKFRSLNLLDKTKTCNHKNFYALINTKKYINTSKVFFANIIDISHHSDDICIALLVSYYISCYPDYVFNSDKSKIENRLLIASNKLVSYIEKIIKNIPDNRLFYEDFSDSIDNYLSLYNIWRFKGKISYLEYIFDKVKERYTILKCTKYNDKYVNEINYNIDSMFLVNPYFTTNILLLNYDVITASKSTKSLFWSYIRKEKLDFDRIFLIIIANLRIKLIHMLKISKARKDLYYLIDVDEILRKMREDKFNKKDIIRIIGIFYDKVRIISPMFKIKEMKEKEDIFDIFASMFNEIYC